MQSLSIRAIRAIRVRFLLQLILQESGLSGFNIISSVVSAP